MVFSRENLILHFSNVCLNSPAYYLPHVRVPFYILRPEPRNAQHIRCDKYLTIAARSGANANRGDSQRFGNLSCQVGWDGFEHDGKTTDVLQCPGGLAQPLCGFGIFALDAKPAETMDGLGCQTKMSSGKT